MQSPEHLLNNLQADDAWVRELARRLVADSADAEDLAQDAWLKALSHRPAGEGALRRWLSTVVRNLAISRIRSSNRRQDRERAASSPDPLPPVTEVLDRENTRHRVAEAVASLDEPYRSAVVYRYFEGLPPKEVAARLGITGAAIESRLRRGLQKLRARLDRDFGDRKTWCAALLPLTGLTAGEATAATAATAGALVMGTKIKIGIAVVVATVCAIAFWSPQEKPAPNATAAGIVGNPDGNGHSEATAPPSEKPEDSAPREPVVANASDKPTTGPRTIVSGIVVDYWTQRPVAGASVSLSLGRQPAGEREWARADLEKRLGPATIAGVDGRFRLEVPAVPDSTSDPSVMTLFARAEGYPMQIFDEVPADAREAKLNLKRGIRLSGRTVDEEGKPVAFASLLLRVRSSLLGVLTSALKSEADGRFVLEGVSSQSFITVEINAAGFVPRLLYFWLEEESPGELTVKLSRGREIVGRVIDSETREPIAGTSVALWVRENGGTRVLQRMETGRDGGYRFEHVEALEGVEKDPGHNNRPLGRPPDSRCLGLWVDAASYAPAWVAIEFGRTQEIALYRSGAIEGLVVNLRGEPMAGVRVEARTRPDILVRAQRLPARIFNRRAREPWACLWTAVTDASGRYRIERVASPPASGRIVAVSVRRRVWERPFPLTHVVVVPGETVTAPPMTNPDPLAAWINGRTVDEAGQPVGGVLVRVGATGRAHSCDDGRFRIPYPSSDKLGNEMVPMFLSHCDFISRRVPVSRAWRDGREMLFRLERGVELSGTVVDRHGRGVTGASIRVRRGDKPIALEDDLWRHDGTVRSAISRHEGTFSTRVAPGPIQVLVAYPNIHRGPFCARFSLLATASAEAMVLPLPSLDMAKCRTVTLRIRVVDETTGKTIGRALSADLLSEIGPWTPEEAKGADGTIVIQKVPAPLEYELRLRVRGYGTVKRRILVSSRSDVCERVIAIGGGGVLRGRIVGAVGILQLPRVVVTAANGDRAFAPAEADGRFEVRGLEAGTYVVELDAGQVPKDPVVAVPTRVAIPAQGIATVELKAEKAGVLCVYLLSPDKEPRPAQPVTFRPRREADEMSGLVIFRRKQRGISILVRDRAGRTWYRGIPKFRFLVPEGVYDVTAYRHGEVIGSGSATTGWKTWIRANVTKR